MLKLGTVVVPISTPGALPLYHLYTTVLPQTEAVLNCTFWLEQITLDAAVMDGFSKGSRSQVTCTTPTEEQPVSP